MIATKEFLGDDVTKYVVSHNLHRRHLTDSQRAMVAARLVERQHGQRRPHGQSEKTDHMIGLLSDLPLSRMTRLALPTVGSDTCSSRAAFPLLRGKSVI